MLLKGKITVFHQVSNKNVNFQSIFANVCENVRAILGLIFFARTGGLFQFLFAK